MDKAATQRAPESKRDKREERKPAPLPTPIAELGNRAALALSRTAAPRIQRACACAGDPECTTCGPMIQRTADGAPAARLPHLPTTGGHGLDRDTLGFMESRFGRSLGDVRIHADHAADTAARAVGARAFTIGRHISFAAGEYSPATREGKHLLAHELAHAVQNERVGTPSTLAMSAIEISDPREPAELAAERAADQVMASESVQTGELATPTLATKLYRKIAVCGPNPQRSASQRNREHQLIQADYLKHINKGGGIEFAIPAASAGGFIGFADLVDVGKKELYEIKSSTIWSIPKGIAEIETYVHQANRHCGKGWKKGKGYPPLWLIRNSVSGGKVLVTALFSPGLIIYQWMNVTDAIAVAAAAAVTKAAQDAAKAAKAALDKLKKKVNRTQFDPVFRDIWTPLASRVRDIVGDVAVGSRFLVVTASSKFISMMAQRRADDLKRLYALNPQTLGTMNFGMTIMAATAGALAAYLGGGLIVMCAPGAVVALEAALASFAASSAAAATEAMIMARAAIAIAPRVAAAGSTLMALSIPRVSLASVVRGEIDVTTDTELVKVVPTTLEHVRPSAEVDIGGTTHQVIGVAEVT